MLLWNGGDATAASASCDTTCVLRHLPGYTTGTRRRGYVRGCCQDVKRPLLPKLLTPPSITRQRRSNTHDPQRSRGALSPQASSMSRRTHPHSTDSRQTPWPSWSVRALEHVLERRLHAKSFISSPAYGAVLNFCVLTWIEEIRRCAGGCTRAGSALCNLPRAVRRRSVWEAEGARVSAGQTCFERDHLVLRRSAS